jgi:hypothetical protein
MKTSQTGDLGYIGGINLKRIGFDALTKIMAIAPLSAESAKRIDSLIASFDETALPLATVFKVRYWGERNQLDAIIENSSEYFPDVPSAKFSDPHFLDRTMTINLIGDNVRTAMALANEPCRQFQDLEISDDERLELEKMDSENGFGKWFASKTKTGWAMLLNARCSDDALAASVRGALNAKVSRK